MRKGWSTRSVTIRVREGWSTKSVTLRMIHQVSHLKGEERIIHQVGHLKGEERMIHQVSHLKDEERMIHQVCHLKDEEMNDCWSQSHWCEVWGGGCIPTPDSTPDKEILNPNLTTPPFPGSVLSLIWSIPYWMASETAYASSTPPSKTENKKCAG